MNKTQQITKNLGGDRLGSGAKMNVSMHNYNRSTHDLSKAWRSSMNVGTLVPCLCEVGLPGDTFSINIEAISRTVPTLGPIYGSFKKQIDIFMCPVRLYNGLLHNNMTKLGLNMNAVKFPKVLMSTKVYNPTKYSYDINGSQIATDSLMNYLGINGIADAEFTPSENFKIVERKFNAVPILAYWDIYKNYYANKQEEKGAYIRPVPVTSYLNMQYLQSDRGMGMENITSFKNEEESTLPNGVTITGDTYQETTSNTILSTLYDYNLTFDGSMLSLTNLELILEINGTAQTVALNSVWQSIDTNGAGTYLGFINPIYNNAKLLGIGYDKTMSYQNDLQILTFNLSQIDQARVDILQNTGLNNETLINTMGAPYNAVCNLDGDGQTLSKYHQAGLAVKTYQSDLLNNWLQTEWIDGVNGINNVTAVDASSGSFSIDALNLANKVYNMLNRIAVSGGSYEDYIEAVYSTEAIRRAESPVYMGGASYEIVFEEVVSQSATQDEPLGTLAGKGTVTNRRGGYVEVKCSEPCFIIGISSITPRLDYSQGNKWFMTELDTLYDLHKPALDGIGFEDLLQERGAWWGSYFDTNNDLQKLKIGKSPAWINYMTSLNETHGDFADEGKTMFMTLNRRYEYQPNEQGNSAKGIKDLTTYIDPTKYNYAFADTSLTAQNFWVQIGFKIIARRVMSAKILPYL